MDKFTLTNQPKVTEIDVQPLKCLSSNILGEAFRRLQSVPSVQRLETSVTKQNTIMQSRN